ncbi:MAG: hypothetical protein AAB677_03335 [Patescibacteria group bacterium]
MMNIKNGFIGVGIIIIVLAILGGGAYLWSQKSVSNSPDIFADVPMPADVNDWKIYRNEQYGLSIKYPPAWRLTGKTSDARGAGALVIFDSGAGEIGINSMGDNLNFSDRPPGTTAEEIERSKMGLDQFMNMLKKNDSMQVKKSSLNGYNAYEVTGTAKIGVAYPIDYKGPTEPPVDTIVPLSIFVENVEEEVFSIIFWARAARTNLTITEKQFLSTFSFSQMTL